MLSLLLTYKYFILLPLAILEGPIITIIAGLFVKSGILNLYLVYLIVVVGDILGDSLAYAIGRFASPPILNKILKLFRISLEKKQKVEDYFNLHKQKTIILSKVIHGFGVAGLLTAGNFKIPYKKYFLTCFLVTILQSAVFLIVGLLFGYLYVVIAKYIKLFSLTSIIVGVVVLLILFFWFKINKL